jgi:4-hydroxy-tetrahydrodipicolinate synthase
MPAGYHPEMFGEVLTAMVTPFKADGSVDYDRYRELAIFLVDHGSDGVVTFGTTGESPTLSDEEKLELLGVALDAVGDRASVVAGAGTYSTAHSVHLTERAQELGAHAILVVTPYYNKPPQRGIVEHFRAIAAATDRPVIAYNIPGRVVVNIETATFAQLAEIPNVTAVKQAHDDLDEARAIVELGLELYSGDDNVLFPFLRIGATGVVSVLAHVVGPQLKAMIHAYKSGDEDEARRIDEELAPAYEILKVAINPIPIKAAMNLLGHELGGHRLPMVPPTEEELARVRDCLERAGQRVPAAV